MKASTVIIPTLTFLFVNSENPPHVNIFNDKIKTIKNSHITCYDYPLVLFNFIQPP